jgi:pyridoxal phosphate enzyme (YggS family)
MDPALAVATQGAESPPSLAERYLRFRAELSRVCADAGRDADSVRLVAVSKYHPAHAIRSLYELGQRDFGENYVQELVQKARELEDLRDLRWHLIGNLQANKAKALVPIAARVDALSSLRAARTLQEHAAAAAICIDVMVQPKVSEEASKSGCSREELRLTVNFVRGCSNLRLRGLFFIGPNEKDPECLRPCFREFSSLTREYGLTEASMGMSNDWTVAIQEGATEIRVGSLIFGGRPHAPRSPLPL